MTHDLATLIAPQPTAFLIDHLARKERFHLKSADRGRYVDLFPWQTIDQLIETDALPPDRFALLRDGNEIHASLYRHEGGKGPLRVATVQDLLRQGCSALLVHVHRAVPAIGRLCAAAERELSCQVGCNAYLTFGTGGAFRPHIDLHDVLVLQIHGRKHWQSFGVPFPDPVEALPETANPKNGPVVWEDTLDAGDILYLPRGEVHHARAHGTQSVHLTIRVRQPRGMDIVDAIAGTAKDSDAVRRDIPLFGGEDARARYQAELKVALHALVERLDVAAFLESASAARQPRPIANLGHDRLLEPDRIVSPAPLRRIALETQASGAREVQIGEGKFLLSAPARQVLDHLLKSNEAPFREIARALSGRLSETDIRDAVAELAKLNLVGIGD